MASERSLPAGAAGRVLGVTDWIARRLALAGGLVLVMLMALTVVDVALRYLFNAPIVGGQEIAEMLLLVVAALAMAYAGRTGGHVALDIFAARFGPRLSRLSDILTRCLAIVVLALIVWRSIARGLSAIRFEEASNLIAIAYAPFYFVLALGFAVYAAAVAAELAVLLRRGTLSKDGR